MLRLNRITHLFTRVSRKTGRVEAPARLAASRRADRCRSGGYNEAFVLRCRTGYTPRY